jgi:hypothetical protein
LPPSSLKKVMAISSGNSIFVAAALCRDPSWGSDGQVALIRRYVGNVGKAGVVILVPPAAPRIRRFDPASWKHINHDDFSGEMADCFQATSLHLSFTEYEPPIDTGSHGGRDGQAFFLESLVSVCDRGEWIADLDVLGTLKIPNCYVLKPCNKRSHDRKAAFDPEKFKNCLTSIDTWLELLDPPNNDCIVRADGNWCGRLATAVVCLQRGHTTLLLPSPDFKCWICVYEWMEWYTMRQDLRESVDDQDSDEESNDEKPSDEEDSLSGEEDAEPIVEKKEVNIQRTVMIIA